MSTLKGQTSSEVEKKFVPPGGTLPVKPLITKLSVRNFMCFKSLDVKCLNQRMIPYEGGEGDGKSAFIIAILIGFGYDILFEEDRKSICGFQIANIIRHGENECRLETTFNLHCCEQLKAIFGPYLTLIRVIHRGHALKSSLLTLAPSDSAGKCFEPMKHVTAAELRLTLDMMGISSNWCRLLLLDETNLSHLVAQPPQWYQLYEQAFTATKRKRFKDLLAMELHVTKMEGDLHWRLLVENHLDSEIQKPYLHDSPMLIHDRESNIKAMNKIQDSMRGIRSEIDTCRNSNTMYQKELEELHVTFHYNMSKIFRKFLSAQQLMGDLLIDLETRKIAIWIHNSKELKPRNIDEASVLWERSPIPRKRIAVIGLYFALWQINETCPIFFVDSFSAISTEFQLPEPVLPLLQILLEEKSNNSRTEHQQFFYTRRGSSQVPLIDQLMSQYSTSQNLPNQMQ